LAVDDGINEARCAFGFALVIDVHQRRIERIEARFDGSAGQMRWRLVEPIL